MKAYLKAEESSIIPNDFSDEELKEFNRCFEEKDPKYLGIHQEFENYQVKLKSHFYIGYMWLDKAKGSFIHISPKSLLKNKQVDYMEMLLVCLQDPIASRSISDIYEIFFKEKWIEVEDKQDEIAPFIILQFLQLLDQIKFKGLKKGYMQTTSNLTSKIQGKILINQTIKKNHLKNRLDKTVCLHDEFSEDCLENRILKTALLQCSRYIGKITNPEVLHLLKRSLTFFGHISSKKVQEGDFKKIKHSSFYKEYKEALRLSKVILKRFGFTIEESTQNKKSRTPPFYINMNELFKRYAQVKLREKYKSDLIIDQESVKIRPKVDFLIKDQKMIINTYYQACSKENPVDKCYALNTLLARQSSIKQRLEASNDEEISTVIIYPDIYGYKNIHNYKKVDNYTNLYSFALSIPLKTNKA